MLLGSALCWIRDIGGTTELVFLNLTAPDPFPPPSSLKKRIDWENIFNLNKNPNTAGGIS